MWDEGWLGGVLPGYYPGYYPGPSQVPILSIFLGLSPTNGQMKAIVRLMMRFPKMGPRKGLELTRIDLRIDLPGPLPDWS